MGGPFAELIRRHQARLFAFVKACTSNEQAAASLFGETFRLMAQSRVDLDADVDPDTMVYRYAVRVRNRYDVGAPDPDCELSRVFEGIDPADRLAFTLLVTSELRIDAAANALRCPEPRLKDALAHALVTITRGEPAPEDATSDAMVAMAAFGWLTPDERKGVEADPTAAPRRAAMEHVLAHVRDLLSPCDPPEALLPRVEAAVEKAMRESTEHITRRPRRAGRMVAVAIGALMVIAGGGFAALQFGGSGAQAEVVVEEAEPEPEPAPAPRPRPVEPPPAIEVAAQGPTTAVDPRLDKASAHARAHRCKKAAKLYTQLVEASPSTAVTGLEPCRGWLKKHRSDKKHARLLGLLK